jgi:hypothetical protein
MGELKFWNVIYLIMVVIMHILSIFSFIEISIPAFIILYGIAFFLFI